MLPWKAKLQVGSWQCWMPRPLVNVLVTCLVGVAEYLKEATEGRGSSPSQQQASPVGSGWSSWVHSQEGEMNAGAQNAFSFSLFNQPEAQSVECAAHILLYRNMLKSIAPGAPHGWFQTSPDESERWPQIVKAVSRKWGDMPGSQEAISMLRVSQG